MTLRHGKVVNSEFKYSKVKALISRQLQSSRHSVMGTDDFSLYPLELGTQIYRRAIPREVIYIYSTAQNYGPKIQILISFLKV